MEYLVHCSKTSARIEMARAKRVGDDGATGFVVAGRWVPEWVEPPALGINVEGNFSFAQFNPRSLGGGG